MRLIDADRFKAYMQEEYLCYDHTLADIDAQPTVDPVKHGHWIEAKYPLFTCSECGATYQDIGYGYCFCPSCEAKMEEECNETD